MRPPFGMNIGGYDEEERNGKEKKNQATLRPSFIRGQDSRTAGGQTSQQAEESYRNQYGHTLPDRGTKMSATEKAAQADNSMDRPEYRGTDQMSDSGKRDAIRAHLMHGMQKGAQSRQNADAMIAKEKSDRGAGGFEVKSNELGKHLSDDKKAQVREAFNNMRAAGQKKPEQSASQQKERERG